MTLSTRLNLLFYGTFASLFFLTSGVFAFIQNYELMCVNFCLFFSVTTISRLFFLKIKKTLLRSLTDVKEGIDTVDYSAKILTSDMRAHSHHQLAKIQDSLSELVSHSESFDEIYADMKRLLIQTVQKKENLVIAKELARICSELRSVMIDLQNQSPESLGKINFLIESFEYQSEQYVITSEIIEKKTSEMEAVLKRVA